MALQNPITGEYIKINDFSFDLRNNDYNIQYYRFKDLDQRQRFEAGLSEYENYFHKQYNGYGHIENQMSSEPVGETTKDAIISACYRALKSDVFKDWIDC